MTNEAAYRATREEIEKEFTAIEVSALALVVMLRRIKEVTRETHLSGNPAFKVQGDALAILSSIRDNGLAELKRCRKIFAQMMEDVGNYMDGADMDDDIIPTITAPIYELLHSFPKAEESGEPRQGGEPSGLGFDFRAHLARQAEFSLRTFGPGSRVRGVADHIRKELAEVEKSNGSLDEWIDVVILGLDGCWRSGVSPDEIIAALVHKQAKNEARKWPDWRTMPADKAIEHDRTGESIPAPRTQASPPAEAPEAEQSKYSLTCLHGRLGVGDCAVCTADAYEAPEADGRGA